MSAEEAAAIERAIGALETRFGIEIVAAIVPRADGYPEIPWRAFALGASVAALAALAIDIGRPDWMSAQALLLQALTILGVACLTGGLAHFWPPFARLFLGSLRAKGEVRQCADTMFLSRELFATPRRDAVLVLVSAFERRVIVLPDVSHRGRVSAVEWETVVDRMTPLLRNGRIGDAFNAGLSAIDVLLASKDVGQARGANTLRDTFVRGDAP
ncbi:MAG TPA: hypothetical protein VNG69_00125 [Casimicrobiaceae bacterium]|nr:hypothetical protein [Casimicrobiaceae bacterium]